MKPDCIHSKAARRAVPIHTKTFFKNSLRLFISAALVFTASERTEASSVIDSFNDVSGANAIEGSPLTPFSTTATAGGIGFITGYDAGNSSVDVLRTNDLVVSLSNYVSGQTNSEKHWSISATIATAGLARRAKTRDITPLSGTIWFSYLASLQNANGDVALTFNGQLGSGTFNATVPGMRVGVGNPAFPGALAVGPVSSQASHTTVTDGVNGAISTNNLAPTDGTAGLVLGRISTDSGTGFPKIEIWYNPDVPNEASLPVPNLTFVDNSFAVVPTSVSRIGYQVVRSTSGIQNEVIDNVKLSDEPNGFDIVYKSAALPLPLLSVTVISEGNEGGSDVVFQISSDRVVSSTLVGTYNYTGLATNGFNGAEFVDPDYSDANFDLGAQAAFFTIPAGQSNATVTLAVIDDAIPEGDEGAGIILNVSADYILGVSSAISSIRENNDANVSLQYMFTRTFAPQIFDTNILASFFSVAGVGGGFSTTEGLFLSPDGSARAAGQVTAANAVDALANGSFMSFFVSPSPGNHLTLTNLQFQALYSNFQFQEPNAAEAVIFLRTSVDNFAADVATWVLQPDSIVFPGWYDLDLPLGNSFSNLLGGVEFRFYIYDDSGTSQVGVRMDDLFISGYTAAAVGVQQVSITNTTDAAEPGTPGQFTVTRAGETTNALTVHYAITGTASNGVDYVALPGSVVIPAGESSTVITITPYDDELIEIEEAVVLTLVTDVNYGVVLPSSATINIIDDSDFGGLVGYLFNESNNTGPSLASLAVASTKHPDKVNALNVSGGPGIGNFGANNAAGVGHGYATATFHSSPSTLFIRGEYLAKSAVDSLAQGGYLSFVLSGKPGYALSLTNFSAYLKMNGTAQETTWAFLRSSIDDFAADIGSTASVSGTASTAAFQEWSVPLNVLNHTGEIEFRLYFYNDTSTIIRIDDVGFQGVAVPVEGGPSISDIAVAGGTVTINFTGGVDAEPADFTLETSTTVNGAYGPDNAAVITGSNGAFQATTAVDGSTRFYQIRAD